MAFTVASRSSVKVYAKKAGTGAKKAVKAVKVRNCYDLSRP
jgi:hypothetical protein